MWDCNKYTMCVTDFLTRTETDTDTLLKNMCIMCYI